MEGSTRRLSDLQKVLGVHGINWGLEDLGDLLQGFVIYWGLEVLQEDLESEGKFRFGGLKADWGTSGSV